MLGDKFRFRFRKSGVLRLLSHHDLMRCFERMLRRADIPFRMTKGFHPTPRLVFALSLPLGVEGLREVVELETIREFNSEDVLTRLKSQAPEGLDFQECRVIPLKFTAVPRRAIYEIDLSSEEQAIGTEQIPSILASPKLWVDRYRPKARQLNIRPFIRNVQVLGSVLRLDLWVTQNGTAKAEELLKILNLTKTLEAGHLVQRVDLEIHDETPADAPDGPPTEAPEHLPLNHVPTPRNEEADDRAEPAWGLSPSGPVVE